MPTEIEDPKTTGNPKAVESSFRLARFVAILALDSGRLQDFLMEREKEMTAAGLTEEEKKLLRHDNFNNLCLYLWEAGPKPTPPDPPPPKDD